MKSQEATLAGKDALIRVTSVMDTEWAREVCFCPLSPEANAFSFQKCPLRSVAFRFCPGSATSSGSPQLNPVSCLNLTVSQIWPKQGLKAGLLKRSDEERDMAL